MIFPDPDQDSPRSAEFVAIAGGTQRLGPRLFSKDERSATMSANGLEVFDKTTHTTNIWFDEMMFEFGPDRQHAETVRCVFGSPSRDIDPRQIIRTTRILPETLRQGWQAADSYLAVAGAER
jgi:hypothetical protein